MRYKIQNKEREKIFLALKLAFSSWGAAANEIGISTRTLTEWRKGTSSVPEKKLEKILIITRLPMSLKSSFEELHDFWYTSMAGKIGAQTTQRLYGNPGTPEGRRRGGLNAIQAHRKNKFGGFRLEKPIHSPRPSKELAEILGIFFGDGHVGRYQTSITLNSETDHEYAEFVLNLIRRKFFIESHLRSHSKGKAIDIVTSSIAFTRFLSAKGMPAGNKIRTGLSIPRWIKMSPEFTKAFLRGLFDTDGCVYLDRHIIKNKKYTYLGWTITSYSDTLIHDVKQALSKLGFHPTHSKNQNSVFLRRHTDIVRYFQIINTSNPKHQNRFRKFLMEKSHSG